MAKIATVVTLVGLVIGLVLIFTLSTSATQEQATKNSNAVGYLQDYGWLLSTQSSPTGNELQTALERFQAFAGIPITGLLDNDTLSTMQLPRCGDMDVSLPMKRRYRRYILQGSRWKARHLYYNISKYSRSLPIPVVDAQISSAFKMWEEAATINFARQYIPDGKVHIDIRFETLDHGDDDIFDGPGGTTAHAYFPEFGGKIHFDDDENWTVQESNGINLFQVAVHEIGHALGLEHSNVNQSVMAPFYRIYQPGFKLYPDDIEAIQLLYGPKGSSPMFLNPCVHFGVDAMTTMADGHTYAFKGSNLYRLEKKGFGISPGFPIAISSMFDSLPDDIDAAITRKNNVTYFFKKHQFWRSSNMQLDSGFPRNISEFFSGVPSFVDAAFVRDDDIYFLKDYSYWKFDPNSTPHVDSLQYPKPISEWGPLPSKINAVDRIKEGFHYITYFMKNDQLWRYDEKSKSIEKFGPVDSNSVSQWFFKCKGAL